MIFSPLVFGRKRVTYNDTFLHHEETRERMSQPRIPVDYYVSDVLFVNTKFFNGQAPGWWIIPVGMSLSVWLFVQRDLTPEALYRLLPYFFMGMGLLTAMRSFFEQETGNEINGPEKGNHTQNVSSYPYARRGSAAIVGGLFSSFLKIFGSFSFDRVTRTITIASKARSAISFRFGAGFLRTTRDEIFTVPSQKETSVQRRFMFLRDLSSHIAVNKEYVNGEHIIENHHHHSLKNMDDHYSLKNED